MARWHQIQRALYFNTSKVDMILKQQPKDFFVEELTSLVPGEQGSFALYRLEKEGWTTLDAVGVIRQRWHIDPRRVSHGGLKDRHAHTMQYLTIFHGPARKLTHQRLNLTYLGQVPQPFTSQHIQANRFRLVLRDFSTDELGQTLAALEEVKKYGIPNYFDDQRFGSTLGHGQFLAKMLLEGKYEEALRLALSAPYPHDRSAQKKEKNLLRSHWGDWPRCRELLKPGLARDLVSHLVIHPDDFRGAMARLRPEMRSLYLAAYQSHLWNRMLAHWLQNHFPDNQLLPMQTQTGTYPAHRSLGADQQQAMVQLTLPLPSSRQTWVEGDPRKHFLDLVLAEENLTLEQFKLKELKDWFFSRGERAALCLPENLHGETGEDELHAGWKKLTLTFTLPRGAYATLIVKRITTSLKLTNPNVLEVP